MDTIKFYEELVEFVSEAKVNLGRKNTATKQKFIEDLVAIVEKGVDGTWRPKNIKTHRNKALSPNSVICLKPTGAVKKRLHQNKGAYVASKGDAQRADDRIGNSPT